MAPILEIVTIQIGQKRKRKVYQPRLIEIKNTFYLTTG